MEKSTIKLEGLCEQAVFENDGTLDDIVFQNKNKVYGAYNLRTGYLKTINRAFYLGTALFVFGLAIPTLYAKLKPKSTDEVSGVITLTQIPPPPVETPPIVIPPPPVDVPDVPTTKYLELEIVPIEDVEELPPTQEDLKDAPASIETNAGTPGDVDIVIDETKPVETPVTIEVEDEKVITFVEQQAFFIGGNAEMAKFLQKNLKYPRQASNAGISGKVFLSFIIDRNGEISDVAVIKGIGFGCDEEAMRVVKAMPKWSPGKQSGRAVKSRFNLPIVFALE
jgi:periplasmic protein TonB